MRILGHYVVFLISMMRMIIADNDDEQQQFSTELLKLHNEYREKHYAKPLVLDEILSQAAMRRAMNFGIDPDSGAELGMNVFFEQNMSKLNAKDVFFSWYNKRKIYTHQDDPEMRSETSSFTQIVWKSTELMGVAVFEGKYYVTLIVTYSPRGNIVDKYMANVVTIADRKDDYQHDNSSNSRRTK